MQRVARHVSPLGGRALAGAVGLLIAISACSDRTVVGPDPHASAASPSPAVDGTTAEVFDLQLTEPASLGSPFLGAATFGPLLQDLSGRAITGELAHVTSGLPTSAGCQPFTDDVAGKIALIRRGTCAFVVKVKNAQNAGAIAVIIYDNVSEALGGMGGSDATITIPAVRVTAALGQQLISAIPITVTLAAVPGEPPVLTLPGDLTVYATTATATGATIRIFVGATDNSGAASVACSASNGAGISAGIRSAVVAGGIMLQDVIPFGSWTVTCSAGDPAGNAASGNFTLVSRPADVVPPTITVPADLMLEATGPSGAIAAYVAAAGDDDGTVLQVDCTPASGSVFAIGNTTVSCTATDAAGNAAAASFAVNVVDTQAPLVTAPADMTVNATTPNGAVVSFSPTASDIVGVVSQGCAGSGSTFPIGTTAVTCFASDAAGNVGTASFHVTVRGAPEQIADLIEATTSLVLPPAQKEQLVSSLQTALADPHNLPRACRALDGYIALVQLASRGTRPLITTAQAAQLIADATRIKAVLGCG